MKRGSLSFLLFVCLSCLVSTYAFCPRDNCVCTNKTALCDGSSFNGSTIPSFDVQTEHLTLKNIKLLELPDQLFVDSSRHYHNVANLRFLRLDNCSIHTIAPNAFYGLDKLYDLQITNNQLTNDGFQANYQIKALGVVNLSGNRFQHIPASLFSMAPNIFQLQMTNNRLKKINLTETTNLSKLRKLDLNGNSLNSLDNANFVFQNNSITILRIDNCNISFIHNESFAQLPELNSLDLSGNPITAEDLTPSLQVLGNSTKLDYLELGNMYLPHLKPPMFSTLTSVTFLNISNSQVHEIDPYSFAKMVKLKELNLYLNGLTSMANLTSIPSLISLNLSHNHIHSLSPLKLPANQLRNIDVSYNVIEALTHWWISNQANVNLINLCCNMISQIDQNSFKAVNAVKVDLSHNLIQKIPDMGVMAHKLDLSYNNIQQLQRETMNKLYSVLDELNLSHNKIKHISDYIFQDMFTLEKLDLSYNKMGWAFHYGHHINLFRHLQHMREIDLSHNGITSFSHDAQFEKNTHLRKLNLSGNVIESFETFPCNSLSRSLEILDLSKNKLKIIDRTCTAKMTFLKEADFSNNPFTCTCPLAEFMHWFNDTHHAPLKVIGLEDREKYKCSNPAKWTNTPVLDYHPAMGTCDFHPRADTVNSTVVGITIGLVLVGIIALVMVLYFGKVCQKLKNFQYNWQIRYKEVYDGDHQVII